MTTTTDRPAVLMQIVFARVMLFVFAAVAAYTGYALLTAVWTVPLAILLWLAAVVTVAIAVAPVPQDVQASEDTLAAHEDERAA